MATNEKKFRPRRILTPWESPVHQTEEIISEGLNDAIRNLQKNKLGAIDAGGPFVQSYAASGLTHSTRTADVLTDAVSGTSGTTLAAIPDPADSPLTADALRDDLVANVLTKIRNALSTLLAEHNRLKVDAENTAKVLNSLIDYLQLRGDIT